MNPNTSLSPLSLAPIPGSYISRHVIEDLVTTSNAPTSRPPQQRAPEIIRGQSVPISSRSASPRSPLVPLPKRLVVASLTPLPFQVGIHDRTGVARTGPPSPARTSASPARTSASPPRLGIHTPARASPGLDFRHQTQRSPPDDSPANQPSGFVTSRTRSWLPLPVPPQHRASPARSQSRSPTSHDLIHELQTSLQAANATIAALHEQRSQRSRSSRSHSSSPAALQSPRDSATKYFMAVVLGVETRAAEREDRAAEREDRR